MAEKVSRRLSYDPMPNMAGLFPEDIPSAPAPVPFQAEAPSNPEPSAVSPPQEEAWQPPAPAPRPTAPPRHQPQPSTRAASTRDESYDTARASASSPRHERRPAPPPVRVQKPARAPAPRRTERPQPVVSSEDRTRRTLRIPLSFDKKLRELAALRGVNLNSAVLAAIEAEWLRAVAERRRS